MPFLDVAAVGTPAATAAAGYYEMLKAAGPSSGQRPAGPRLGDLQPVGTQAAGGPQAADPRATYSVKAAGLPGAVVIAGPGCRQISAKACTCKALMPASETLLFPS